MFRCIVLLVGGVAWLWSVPLSAQDAVLGQKYGSGVHAYFSGDYSRAFEQLNAAIEAGSQDPRAFYFRGLAYLRLGRPQEAKQDFHQASGLESKDINKFYDVSRALERVQGSARVELESYRVDARMAAMEQAEKLRKARYEAIQREEARVLRQQPPEPIKPPDPTAEPAADAAVEDPFTAPEEKPGKTPAKADKKPAGEAPAAEKPAADAPADGDPFAVPAQKPAAEKKTGVLGAMGKALGKAVGGEPENAPAAEQKPDDAANPFAEKPAAEKPAAEKPAEKKANPDDPFAQ